MYFRSLVKHTDVTLFSWPTKRVHQRTLLLQGAAGKPNFYLLALAAGYHNLAKRVEINVSD